MFLSILTLLIAIVGGALLTYLYSSRMPLAARVCAGVCTGYALLAGVGFVIASLMGRMTATTAVLAAVPLLLPWLVLSQADVRSDLGRGLRSARVRLTSGPYGMMVFFILLAVGVGIVFSHAMFTFPDGIYTGVANNLGDLPFHIQIISSFAYGQNFPPQDPAFAGVRFAYPFMADFLTALLVRDGASIGAAMWIQNVTLAMALAGLLWYWTRQLTGDRLAAYLAPILVFLSGGLGWLRFLDEAGASDDLFGLLQRLPHEYTIIPETIYRWGNSLTTLFIPQRSILFGLPVAIVIFAQWWFAVVKPDADDAEEAAARKKTRAKSDATLPEMQDLGGGNSSLVLRRMMAAGVFAGLLPLIHAHSYIVIMGIAACLALLFWNWRAWAAFFVPALLLGGLEGLWSTHGAAVKTQTFLGWQIGWDRGQADPIWFWWMNTGLFIPLLLCALFWRKEGKPIVSSRLLRFYLPFVLCFLVPNVLKMAPWIWDNIKVLFYWYVASVPLVALVLARWWRERAGWKLITAGCVVVLTLSGALDLFRVAMGTENFNSYREFDNDGIAIAAQIRERTAPHAVIIGAMTYNPPAYLTGRRVLLGYPGTIWSRGLDAGSRYEDIRSIYAGAPEAIKLLRQYKVDYAIVSPLERREMPVDDLFWQQFPVIAEAGPYRVYDTGEGK